MSRRRWRRGISSKRLRRGITWRRGSGDIRRRRRRCRDISGRRWRCLRCWGFAPLELNILLHLVGVDQLGPADLLRLGAARGDGLKVGNGLRDGPAVFLRLKVAQFNWLQARGGQHLVVADWLALNNFAIIRRANLLGLLGAPGGWFPILVICCVAEGLEPFLANLLGIRLVAAPAVLMDWCVAESSFVLKWNFLELNFAVLVEHFITLLLLAVDVLGDECVVANLHIFMPALFHFIFFNVVYGFILCTANSSICESFFIGAVVNVDSTTTVVLIMMRKR